MRKQEGYIVLITVIILGAVSSIVVGFLLVTGQNASLASSGVVANSAAKAGATACAQLALGALQASPALITPSTNSVVVNSAINESCSYSITGTTPTYTIASTGTVVQGSRTFVHRISVTTSQTSPTVTVTSWQDVQ